ncbi:MULTISPECIES: GNAT family N-acetyltransferase [unclassified Streptomyces]|uniref:GNAT family N-acetyltransferase n=1 Tax=unclassified Streptomyces TaxID=2593676 RepID=UPI003815B7E1
MEGVSIRPARPVDPPFLDALVQRSKSHWTGGRAEDVPALTPKLTVADITTRHTTVAERGGDPVGFHTLNEHADYLGIGLFLVDRPFIGTGVGRLLRGDLVRRAAALGARVLGVGAEPRAEGFDQRTGMVTRHGFEHNGERLIGMTSDVAAIVHGPARRRAT